MRPLFGVDKAVEESAAWQDAERRRFYEEKEWSHKDKITALINKDEEIRLLRQCVNELQLEIDAIADGRIAATSADAPAPVDSEPNALEETETKTQEMTADNGGRE